MLDNTIETLEDLLVAHELVKYPYDGIYVYQCFCGWRPTLEEITLHYSEFAAHTHHVAVQLAQSHLSTLRIAWSEGHETGWDDRDEDVRMGWTPSGYNQGPGNPYRKDSDE